MSLWTPDGERPVRRGPEPAAPAPDTGPADGPSGADGPVSDEQLAEAARAIGVDLASLSAEEREGLQAELAAMLAERARVQAEMAKAPPEQHVVNHLQGLFEMVVVYLQQDTPNFAGAAIMIEALGALAHGTEQHLGPYADTARDMLSTAQMLFVQVKEQSGAPG